MRKSLIALGIVFAVLGGIAWVVFRGTEVVVLHTIDAGGQAHATSIWVVDDGGAQWLRSEHPNSGWYRRLTAHPDVTLERAGGVRSFRAVPVASADARDRINRLMAEKYRTADRVVGAMVDHSKSVPIRLEPE